MLHSRGLYGRAAMQDSSRARAIAEEKTAPVRQLLEGRLLFVLSELLVQSDFAKEKPPAQHMICLWSSSPRQLAIVRHLGLRPRMRRVSGLHASLCSQSGG
jgi:hypothetical protein